MNAMIPGGPGGMPPRKPEPQELRAILDGYASSVEGTSPGRPGAAGGLGGLDLEAADLRRADLRRADLRGLQAPGADLCGARLDRADLRGANLAGAKLRSASLVEADLSGADLTDAVLLGANLTRVDFKDAQLRGARLRDSRLDGARLIDAKSLLAGQLGGATLAGTTLTEGIAKFEGLANVTEASKATQNLFTSIVLVCAYTFLTIASTTDAQLLNNAAPPSSRLPILGTDIPLVRFYAAAPLLLLCMYLYFHLQLQRLWEELSELPAVFPDGRPLDKKAYPWLLNVLVRDHLPRLRENRTHLARWQSRISSFFAWGLVPLTVTLAWARYLHAHDWFLTTWHIIGVAAGVGIGVAFLRLAEATLRGAEKSSAQGRRAWKTARAISIGVGVGVASILGMASLGVIEGVNVESVYDDKLAQEISERYWPIDVRRWAPAMLSAVGLSSSASLSEAPLSIKPANWSPNRPELLDSVKGADLEHRRNASNLRHAMAYNSFGANAYLQESDLRWSDFRESDLRRADFRRAWLEGINFRYAKLAEADFRFADLTRARFREANIDQAKFLDATMRQANFSEASLRGANFTGSTLVDANLSQADLGPLPNLDPSKARPTLMRGVDLTGADLTNANLAEVKLGPTEPDPETKLVRASKLVRAHLDGAVMAGADLTAADLTGASLRRVILTAVPDASAPDRLRSAVLIQARLELTDLTEADLTAADLSNADLRGATLAGARLDRANLSGADLSGAIGLTDAQIATAITDTRTRLPSAISRIVADGDKTGPFGAHPSSNDQVLCPAETDLISRSP
jgi:uncharacterized protein YjbI with pentapeptide repeats